MCRPFSMILFSYFLNSYFFEISSAILNFSLASFLGYNLVLLGFTGFHLLLLGCT